MEYDVAIVGGGPSGSTAAMNLSKKGYKVILFEKEKFPREKPCGGGLTKSVLDEFSYLKELSLIEIYSYSGALHSPSLETKIEVKKDHPLVGMVSRKEFDYKLAKLAEENGAVLKENSEIIDFKILNDKVEIYLKNGKKVHSKILIGADGVWSRIAKKSRLRQEKIDYGLCIVEEFTVEEKTMDKYFTKKRICHIHSQLKNINGYAWVFPKKKQLNIGLGEFLFKDKAKPKTNMKKLFVDYIKLLQKYKIIPDSIIVKNPKGGALPIRPLEKTYSDRLVLIGDAAGFASASSGEGFYYAMRSAKLASIVINKALKDNDLTEKTLSKYQKLWKKDFGKDLEFFYNQRKNQKVLSEYLINVAKNSDKLTDLILGIGLGTLSIVKVRWKIIILYIFANIKYRIKGLIHR